MTRQHCFWIGVFLAAALNAADGQSSCGITCGQSNVQLGIKKAGIASDIPNNLIPTAPTAGYTAWFDATNPATTFADEAGTTPSVANGVVQRWQSQGGSFGALDVRSTGGSMGVTLKTIPPTNFRSLHSDASANGVLTDVLGNNITPDIVGTAGSTVFAVGYRASSQPGGAGLWGANNNALTMAWDTIGGYGLRAYLNDGGFQSAPIVATPNGVPHVFTWVHNGTTLKVGVDDTRTASLASVAAGTTITGTQLVLLGYAGPSGYCDCDLAEVIFYKTALSEDDRKQTETYLGNKWAIPLPY